MLKPTHRLRDRRDFARVYSTGKSHHSALLRVTVAPSPQMTTHFGVVISNAVAKSAVVRNRKKRQIRAAIHPLLSQVKVGQDIVVAFKAPGVKASFQELRENLLFLLKKAGVV